MPFGYAIGDTGEKQHLIKTLPRKGFRFVARVQEDKKRTVEPVGSTEHRGDTTHDTNFSGTSVHSSAAVHGYRATIPSRTTLSVRVTEEPNDGLAHVSTARSVIGMLHTAFSYE